MPRPLWRLTTILIPRPRDTPHLEHQSAMATPTSWGIKPKSGKALEPVHNPVYLNHPRLRRRLFYTTPNRTHTDLVTRYHPLVDWLVYLSFFNILFHLSYIIRISNSLLLLSSFSDPHSPHRYPNHFRLAYLGPASRISQASGIELARSTESLLNPWSRPS